MAMNRFDRVTAILIQLQSRKTTKAQDLAKRFGVTLRTIYRDIRSLEAAGIPLYGEAGLGYSLAEGYRLAPVTFTQAEAVSLLTAEKLMEKLADGQIQADYRSALFKIKAVLGSRDKDRLESLEESMAVRGRPGPASGGKRPDGFPIILRSLAEKKVLAISYAGLGKEETRRKVEPVGVIFDETQWHLVAYCRLRRDFRDFRLDRIAKLELSGETFANRHPPLKQVLEQANRDRNLEPVALLVAKRAVPYLEEAKYVRGFILQSEKEDGMEMHFLTASLDDFAHWYVGFAEYARILAPEALKGKVAALLERKAAAFDGQECIREGKNA
jgi:predicted DNA-binding transcriptional regulator YafY